MGNVTGLGGPIPVDIEIVNVASVAPWGSGLSKVSVPVASFLDVERFRM
jgi:hypothetical protein